MSLNKFYDFMQVLYSARKLPTNNYYFCKYILFSMNF
jgi:hypothetical protein